MKFKVKVTPRKWSRKEEKWGKLVVTAQCDNYNKDIKAMEVVDQPFELFVGGYHMKKVEEDWAMGTEKMIEVRANGEPYKTADGSWRYSVNLTFEGFAEAATPAQPLFQNNAAPAGDDSPY